MHTKLGAILLRWYNSALDIGSFRLRVRCPIVKAVRKNLVRKKKGGKKESSKKEL